MDLSRSFRPSQLGGVQLSVRDSLNVEYRRRLRPGLSVSGGTIVFRDRNEGDNAALRSDRVAYQGFAGLVFEPKRQWRVAATYRYQSQERRDTDFEATRHYLQLRITYLLGPGRA